MSNSCVKNSWFVLQVFQSVALSWLSLNWWLPLCRWNQRLQTNPCALSRSSSQLCCLWSSLESCGTLLNLLPPPYKVLDECWWLQWCPHYVLKAVVLMCCCPGHNYSSKLKYSHGWFAGWWELQLFASMWMGLQAWGHLGVWLVTMCMPPRSSTRRPFQRRYELFACLLVGMGFAIWTVDSMMGTLIRN